MKSSIVSFVLVGLAASPAFAQSAELDAGVPPPPAAASEDKGDASAERGADEGPGPGEVAEPPSAPPPTAEDAGAFDPFAATERELAIEGAGSPSPEAPSDELFRVSAIDIVATLDDEAKTASVYVLDEEALERFDFDDAHQVLTQVPGVYVRQEDGYGLRPNIGMRGADPDRSKKVTLMEDGVLFGPAPYSAPAAYYFPIITRMTSVEVFKGVESIRHGPQTIGGGLDLRTRETPTEGTRMGVDASAGNTFYTKLHVYGGVGNERAGLIAEGVHLSSTGFKELDGGGDTGFSKQELMVKGRFNTDPHARVYQRLELKLGYSREDSLETYLGLSDADFRDNPLRRYAASRPDEMQNWRTQGELRHTLGIGEHVELLTALYRHDFRRTWDRADRLVNNVDNSNVAVASLSDVLRDPVANRPYFDLLRGSATSDQVGARLLQAGNQREFVSQGVQTVLSTDFQTGPVGHALEVGLRLHQDQIQRRHSAIGYDFVAQNPDDPVGAALLGDLALVPDGEDRALLAKNEVSTIAFAAHAVYGVTYRRLTLTPGIRAEIIRSAYTEQDPSSPDRGEKVRFDPNALLLALGARYAVTDALSLIAGAQQGITPVAPDAAPLASGTHRVADEEELERAVNYEAGLRFFREQTQAQVFGFLSHYDQVVTPCDELCMGSAGLSFRSGAAVIYGVEVGGSSRVSLARGYGLPLRAAYTYTRAEFTEAFTSAYEPYGGTGDSGRVDDGDELPYVPPHQLNVGAGVDWQQKVGLDLAVSFMDQMREEAGQGPLEPGKHTDRYALLDLSAFYQILEQVRLYLKGDNLTNSQPVVSRRPFGARPNKPLLVQIGVRWEM